jgi:hypothetical protein
MSQQQTEDGIKWIEAQVNAMAEELDIQLDGPPEWDDPDPLNFKMAVEVAGRREILTLWRPHIDDSQGGNNQPTREVRAKLQAQIRAFMGSFAPPKRRIGF